MKMRTTITSLIYILGLTSCFAQDPAILWQNTIGGSHSDQVLDISPTRDGGYIIGGNTLSGISGDKTEDSRGSWDIWTVKINGTGALEWEKTIGTSGFDGISSIFQTVDGGYLVTAESSSNISGDKTENSRGSSDFWILKLDASGSITWQHTYGGSESDYGAKALQLLEGGYIVAGNSKSGISGDKTDASHGEYDIWVLKLDTNGSIVWQKTIGGSSFDIFESIALTNDGGYIINTTSDSPASGDKSENQIGSDDYWVVKLNADGTIEWDKTLGGTDVESGVDAIPTMDGGYLIGGYSMSPASGDKSEDPVGKFDYWLVKLDGNGGKVWDRTVGREYDDYLTDIVGLPNGGFLLTGSSQGIKSESRTHNKTAAIDEPSKGYVDNWFVTLDASGVITGEKIIGGDSHEFPANVVLTSDGGFVVGTSSDSYISGDKTQDSKGRDDYWIYKMASTVLDLSDFTIASSISYYPNPTNGNFTIDLCKEYSSVTIQITNMLGKVISTSKYASVKTIEQEIEGSSGIYFVNIDVAQGASKSLKIIKN